MPPRCRRECRHNSKYSLKYSRPAPPSANGPQYAPSVGVAAISVDEPELAKLSDKRDGRRLERVTLMRLDPDLRCSTRKRRSLERRIRLVLVLDAASARQDRTKNIPINHDPATSSLSQLVSQESTRCGEQLAPLPPPSGPAH
jgi:hypothetical protein